MSKEICIKLKVQFQMDNNYMFTILMVNLYIIGFLIFDDIFLGCFAIFWSLVSILAWISDKTHFRLKQSRWNLLDIRLQRIAQLQESPKFISEEKNGKKTT